MVKNKALPDSDAHAQSGLSLFLSLFLSLSFSLSPSSTPFIWREPLVLARARAQHTFTPKLIATVFTIARTWKQSRCALREEWIKKSWYIYTREF